MTAERRLKARVFNPRYAERGVHDVVWVDAFPVPDRGWLRLEIESIRKTNLGVYLRAEPGIQAEGGGKRSKQLVMPVEHVVFRLDSEPEDDG
jgi:hypothetical protein